ncbi:MAG: 16S rRNA (cytosine(967)-C(5))-methyltransferase RsmB [Clostridia bacterium]|nr:16S rRNA (cytosine(967)-C(5))-methyltransferase RsmB [Clostridia bacterium]
MNRARTEAFLSLTKSIKDKKYSNLEMNTSLEKSSLSPEDRSLYTRLYLGVLEKKITIDYLLSQISTIALNTLSAEVLCLLELGAYQILYMDKIPDRAAIFETVEIAKRNCKSAVSFINAVLRRISQEKNSIFSYLDLPGKKGLSLKYGYPRHLVSLWQNAYGKEMCEKILIAQNTPARLTIRVNTLKISFEEYSEILKKENIPFHKNPLCKNGITIEKGLSPLELFGFKEGLFFVQDAAAQRAIDRLGAKRNDSVLDLCASPGGKSFSAAVDMENCGKILSLELHKNRLGMIEDGAKRLGISILEVQENDSSVCREDLRASFDRVICDVPCSGYGTIAKKPDIRHKNPEDASLLPPLQLKILMSGADALKKGGRILYSTCTLNPAENEDITNAFLASHPNFIRIGEPETLFPVGGENDGFFCDLLEKIND